MRAHEHRPGYDDALVDGMNEVGLRLGHLGFEAGVDCLEHGIYMTAEHARYMAEHGVALVPTLSTMHGICEHGIEYGMPESWIPIAEAILEPHRQSFQHALDAGVLFAAETDGFGELVTEIELFASFG